MKILILSNYFKGSISSINVNKIIERFLKNNFKKITIKTFPITDGGDGFLDFFIYRKKGKIINKKVKGPLNKKVNAKYFISNENAYIEIAESCGIKYLQKKELKPLKANTFGVGELIKDAINKKVKNIYLGLGGTASSDAGLGMAKALGFSFLDEKNKEISLSIEGLLKLKKINFSKNKKIKRVNFFAITDVKNPLLGKNGSAKIYGPQKGASEKEVIIIEKALRNFSNIIKKDLKKSVSKIKGGGSAGGLGAGLYAFLNSDILKGSKFVSKEIKLEKEIKNSDLIITGEGKFDKTSFLGKITGFICNKAIKLNKKILIITGESKIKNKKIKTIEIKKFLPLIYSIKNPEKSLNKVLYLNREKIDNLLK